MKTTWTSLLKISFALGLCACSQKVQFGLPPGANNFGQSVAYNNKVDIIWIMDNSSSMLQHQNALSTQVPVMIQKLNALKLDYHMGVITTSMGNGGNGGVFIGSPLFLTNATADIGNVMASRLVVGETGDNLERGIDSLVSVLSPSYLNGPGAGFLRSDAFLAVIALSDEDDQSARTLSNVTDFLDSVKPRWIDGTRSWSMNFIGVLVDSTQCRGFNNHADPGEFYKSLASASNGTQESICSTDFTSAVTNIRARLVQILTDFKLKQIPDVSTITVFINGQSSPQDAANGWTYESTGNLVRFHGTAIPPADAAIVVNFTPAAAN